jgi:hypothetical protein
MFPPNLQRVLVTGYPLDLGGFLNLTPSTVPQSPCASHLAHVEIRRSSTELANIGDMYADSIRDLLGGPFWLVICSRASSSYHREPRPVPQRCYCTHLP